MNTKAILPFNMSIEEYREMMKTPFFPYAVYTLMLIPVQGISHREIARAHAKLKGQLPLLIDVPAGTHIVPPAISSVVLCDTAIVGGAEIRPDTPLTPKQEAWIKDGIYLQFGVIKEYSSLPGIAAAATAMLYYDMLVDSTGTTDPDQHQPLMVTEAQAADHCEQVNQAYSIGDAFWNLEMNDFRNQRLISARALLSGKDPEEAREEFIASKRNYFLDHPWSNP